MDPRIAFVDATFGFLFEEGFARKFESLGSPSGDLEFWFRNATVYRTVTADRPIAEDQRIRLVTMIEAIRFDAMCGALPGEDLEFDLSAYEFTEDLLLYKGAVVHLVLTQEAESPSEIDPPQATDTHIQ